MAIGDVTYTDMLGGRVTFTQIESSTVRMAGQFHDGFYDPNARVLIHVGDCPPRDLDLTIIPPGTSVFQCDYQDVTIKDFTDVSIRIIAENKVIAVGDTTVTVE
ncbi:hypothetical protein ADK70_38620 [Streptomyces rimosus subsp. pseudoverticillatus]|uniref:hypothetical protein n=1 Tax=Streptomyces rimosus TaxID=1927 RepID=UPI0006B27C60|nr:hypothetical protein [Streptomyces rimosus]KOT76388.1 hypothetical protein ADK70_38620 [Streptomyces rimosus subsp. pseudoverticillatus]